jgi:hypothetical protein
MMPLLLTAALVVASEPAGATSRTLFRSKSFLLQAHLDDRLLLRHVNRTDYPLRFHCTSRIEEVRYRTSGTLIPHEIWRPHQRATSTTLQGSTAECDVNVRRGLTLFWKDRRLEVLGKELTQPDGSPKTRLAFYDITKEKVGFHCEWDQTENGQTSHQSLSDRLPGFGVDRLDAPGVDLSTVSGFTCSES